MPLQPNGRAPYTSVSAATTAIDAFRDTGMATPITTDVLIRAGVPETIARRTLTSLVELDLIDDTGNPSPTFEAFRTIRDDDEYRQHVQDWLREVYADILRYADPSTDPHDKVQGAFRGYEPGGQRPSMAALLVGLWQYAGLPVPENSPAKSTRSSKPTTKRSTSTKRSQSAPDSRTSKAAQRSELTSTVPGALMAVTPEDVAEMTEDEFTQVWAALGKVALARARKLKTPKVPEVSPEQEDGS